MKKILFIALIAMFFVNNTFTQVRKYTIIANGQNMGVLTAVQTMGSDAPPKEASGDAAAAPVLAKNEKKIDVFSQFDIHLFIPVHVKYNLSCKYINGDLVESSVETYKDDDLHSSTKGEKMDGTSQSVRNGDESTYDGEITYSGAMLYFKEPKGIKKIVNCST